MKPDYLKKIVPDITTFWQIRVNHLSHSIVLCHGCFDIVHPGHIRHLAWAATQGNILVVTVTDDRYVNKGPGRPYFPVMLRVEQVAALEFVDFVYVSLMPTAVEIIASLRPDFYVKGPDVDMTNAGFQSERNFMKLIGGRFLQSPGDVVYHSSDLMRHHGCRNSDSLS